MSITIIPTPPIVFPAKANPTETVVCTTSQTVPVPAGCKLIEVEALGGGEGGMGGARYAPGTRAPGGDGGRGGNYAKVAIPNDPSNFPIDSLTVAIGAGGAGGPGRTDTGAVQWGGPGGATTVAVNITGFPPATVLSTGTTGGTMWSERAHVLGGQWVEGNATGAGSSGNQRYGAGGAKTAESDGAVEGAPGRLAGAGGGGGMGVTASGSPTGRQDGTGGVGGARGGKGYSPNATQAGGDNSMGNVSPIPLGAGDTHRFNAGSGGAGSAAFYSGVGYTGDGGDAGFGGGGGGGTGTSTNYTRSGNGGKGGDGLVAVYFHF